MAQCFTNSSHALRYFFFCMFLVLHVGFCNLSLLVHSRTLICFFLLCPCLFTVLWVWLYTTQLLNVTLFSCWTIVRTFLPTNAFLHDYYLKSKIHKTFSVIDCLLKQVLRCYIVKEMKDIVEIVSTKVQCMLFMVKGLKHVKTTQWCLIITYSIN